MVSLFRIALKRFSDIDTKSEQEEMLRIALDFCIDAIFFLSVDSAFIVAFLCFCSISYRSFTAVMFVVELKAVVVEVVIVLVVLIVAIAAVVVVVLIIVSNEVGDVISVPVR